MSRNDTLVHRLLDHADRHPSRLALQNFGSAGSNAYRWSEYATAVREVGRGLIAVGLDAQDRVGILASNRAEWVIAQFGAMAARTVPAPMYATLVAEQIAFVLRSSGARAVFFDTAEQLTKIREADPDGDVTAICLLPEAPDGTLSLEALRAKGRETSEAELDARLDGLTDAETSLLIYTSGTTGEPKGAMLNHGGMVSMSDAALGRFPELREGVRYVSYLPLCHVAEQFMTNYNQMAGGGEVTFVADPLEVRDALLAVRPTVFLGVPRVWEKMMATLQGRLREATGIKAKLASWAMSTELAGNRCDIQRDDGQVRTGLARKAARRLVIDKVKAALGLDQLKVAVTGAAPISKETLEFFASLGIIVYEGYGMTETSGVATCSDSGRPRFGTVGRPLDGVEVRIANDSEVLLRGRIMTTGYFGRPELTAELIDAEGWVHTGDLGRVDAEGNLSLTGRKKDIIITAGGKNIAPAQLEDYLTQIEGIGQAVVVGDRKPYLGALVTLDAEALAPLAASAGVSLAPRDELARNPRIRQWLLSEVESKVSPRLARVQSVKRIRILTGEFTVDSGELTPTMKLKRNVVTSRYSAEIEALYEADS